MADALHTPVGCCFNSLQGTKGANPKERYLLAPPQAAAARTTASTPPARRLRPGDKGLAACSAGGGQDPLWGPFPSPQLKTGGSVPLEQEEARMRKKKRRSDEKG